MKTIYCLIACLFFAVQLFAQEPLFSPVSLQSARTYDTRAEILSDPQNKVLACVSKAYLVGRNDSIFIAFYQLGRITEFEIPGYWLSTSSEITSIEKINHSHGPDLFLIKSTETETMTNSAWRQSFHLVERWLIITDENPSIVLEAVVRASYDAKLYSYEKDITDPNLRPEETERLIKNRKTETDLCELELKLDIAGDRLTIYNPQPSISSHEMCETHLKAGSYALIKGAYWPATAEKKN